MKFKITFGGVVTVALGAMTLLCAWGAYKDIKEINERKERGL